MKYFRVKESSDNVNVYFNRCYTGFLVARELITEREFFKRHLDSVNPVHFEVVEVSKKATHWFFGARFADNYPYSDFAKSKYYH